MNTGNWKHGSTYLNLSIRQRWVANLRPGHFTTWKTVLYQHNTKLDGPHGPPGRLEKYIYPLPRIEPSSLDRTAGSSARSTSAPCWTGSIRVCLLLLIYSSVPLLLLLYNYYFHNHYVYPFLVWYFFYPTTSNECCIFSPPSHNNVKPARFCYTGEDMWGPAIALTCSHSTVARSAQVEEAAWGAD
jgi:hypothetical protein